MVHVLRIAVIGIIVFISGCASLPQGNANPLDGEQIQITMTSVLPGTVNCMGTITPEGTAQILPQVRSILVMNDASERALAYIKESFGSSRWIKRFDR